ncbi:MAG TPA: hypothetical protein VH723_04720 [Candidatus Limnocylindrales bacterium]
MEPRAGARRDLVLGVATVIGVSRFVDGPLIWLVVVFLFLALLLGTLQVLAAADPFGHSAGVPVEALLTPTVAGMACLGAIRLVPVGMWLALALALAWLLIDRTIRIEAQILLAPRGPTSQDRARLLVQALIVAFVAFAGAAALVPGGLPEPVPAGVSPAPLSEANLLLLASIDALVAGLLGFRVSALRATQFRAVLWSAATYASAIAIGAAALRAMDVPRLIGPAMLTLVFFLWDAFHGAPPARRRDPRWIWQTALLVGLGAIVIVWNLGLRPR